MAYRFEFAGANAVPYGNDQLLTFTALSVTAIAGWTIQFTLRLRPGQSVLLTKAATVTDAVNGVFTVLLAATDTTGPPLNPGRYWYACRRIDSGSNDLLAFGDFVIIPSQ